MQTHLDELAGAVDVALSEKNLNEDGLLALTTPQARSIGARLSGRRGRSRGGAVTKRFRPLPSDAPLVSAVDRNE